MTSREETVKRGVDAVVAALVLVLGLPLWFLIALIVVLTSRGPAIHIGRRVGKDGKEFGVYKFRTMRAGAWKQGPGITSAGDPRVTPIGRVLRSTKLDEVPQLLNVVRGEMSLVGPRPEAPEYVALYNDPQREVLTIRPGITGPTQLAYRHEERLLTGEDTELQYLRAIMPRKLEMDLEYVRSRSLPGDVRVILRTLASLVR